MQYVVSIFKQYRASNLEVEPTHRNYKPAHKIYANNKQYVNKWTLKHLLGMTCLIHGEQTKQFAALCKRWCPTSMYGSLHTLQTALCTTNCNDPVWDYGNDKKQKTNTCVTDEPLNIYVPLFHSHPLKMRGRKVIWKGIHAQQDGQWSWLRQNDTAHNSIHMHT
jgi:hypothetical protein